MTNEYTHTLARIHDSIKRIPDRLSTPNGEAVRSEFAGIFGRVIIGHEDKDGGLYLTLPFQVSLLTDPVLYVIAGGLLVLDHPTRRGESAFAFGDRAPVIDIPRNCSLYANRYPRIIALTRRQEEIRAGWMVKRIASCGFYGPFSKEAV